MKKQNKSSAPNKEQLNKWNDYQKKHMVFFDKNHKLWHVYKYHGVHLRRAVNPSFKNDTLAYFCFDANYKAQANGCFKFYHMAHLVINIKTGNVIKFVEDFERKSFFYFNLKGGSFLYDDGKKYTMYSFDGEKYLVSHKLGFPVGWKKVLDTERKTMYSLFLATRDFCSEVLHPHTNPEHKKLLDKYLQAKGELP